MSNEYPYIKPTRYRHDSGYRCFEVGYCYEDDKGNFKNRVLSSGGK